MPIYIYEHPVTGERKEIVQRMTETHEYKEKGVEWKRVFESPSAKVDTLENLDPNDRAGFVKRTAKKGMTVGDMWDESKRLSDKRAKVHGYDPVKQKATMDYFHRTQKRHPHADK